MLQVVPPRRAGCFACGLYLYVWLRHAHCPQVARSRSKDAVGSGNVLAEDGRRCYENCGRIEDFSMFMRPFIHPMTGSVPVSVSNFQRKGAALCEGACAV
eukprot:scaffold499_cov335-Pavlova_lutheri.AAC.35